MVMFVAHDQSSPARLGAVESNHQFAWFRARCLTVWRAPKVYEVPSQGFEPRSPESRSGVLPLDELGALLPCSSVGCRGFEPLIFCLKDSCLNPLGQHPIFARRARDSNPQSPRRARLLSRQLPHQFGMLSNCSRPPWSCLADKPPHQWHALLEHGRQDSNPQLLVLETSGLPIDRRPYTGETRFTASDGDPPET